ncbi:MAG: type IV pilus assembly protein PilM [Armatimonadetes bacterium]|nr:type IV pilus assembly protein PilM [Armatimonadota bacterium]
MLSSLFSKESTVGIDIGSSFIKAVEVTPTTQGWEVAAAAVEPCPRETMKDGVITNVHEVAAAIRGLLREAGIRATGAICGISGSQVIVRQVQFPKMTEAVLRKSIKYEASKYVSSSIEDSVVEFEIIGDAEEPGQMNVWLVAAPREMIDSRVAVLESAGLEPLAIDVEAFALIRSVVELSSSDRYLHETVALVDMGASHTDVNVVSRGEFALTRNIPIAGDSFTNAIKNLTGASFDESEQMKLEMARQCPLDELDSGDSECRSWRVVQPLIDELIREIRRSINFYHSQFPEGHTEAFVGKVILTGGSARMLGMDRYMSSKLGIPTEVARLFEDSAISIEKLSPDFLDKHRPVLAIGAGLAIKELIADVKQKAA